MPVVASPTSPLDSVKVKMEDRKRPAPDGHSDSCGPSKRQAVTVNGANPSKTDEEFPWKEDIDRYQKDAILRQMREYKREKTSLEQQLSQVVKRSEHHDEHLRIIDAWFLQLVDELSVFTNSTPPTEDKPSLEFSTSLLSADIQLFNQHLSDKSEQIKASLSKIFQNLSVPQPDVRQLQERISSLLALQKQHTAELQRAITERDQLDDRLFNATTRYMNAEKQLERAKSAQVAKIEAQARTAAAPDPGNEVSEAAAAAAATPGESNGVPASADTAAVELARNQAVAASEKQREQLEKLTEEIKTLSTDLALANSKISSLTDDDYAHTELFKYIKTQHGDVIKRINDLEARNLELVEEAKQLHAERASYKEEADNEVRNTTIEIQGQLSQTEADLARIRNARDELLAEVGIRKATTEQQRTSLDQYKELCEAKETRIGVLEAEMERLRSRENPPTSSDSGSEAANLDVETARSKLQAAESEKSSLEQELRSMETAWKKASSLASKKVAEVADAEERISRMAADKAKAEQKYFAAMKLKETRDYEIKAIKTQNLKSSEIVSQLKDKESSCQALVSGLEKQLAEANASLQAATNQCRTAQQSASEYKSSIDQLNARVAELSSTVAARQQSISMAQKHQRSAEVKAEELEQAVSEASKEAEKWKKSALLGSGEDFTNMRKLCFCTVCDSNIKDTVITTCSHVLCKSCIDRQIQLRSRRCPICNKAFGGNDTFHVQL